LAVHAIVAARGASANVLGRRNLWSRIEFVLQPPLESHKVLALLPYQYPCLDRVITEHPFKQFLMAASRHQAGKADAGSPDIIP
jgi:hypothetical protein